MIKPTNQSIHISIILEDIKLDRLHLISPKARRTEHNKKITTISLSDLLLPIAQHDRR